MLSSTTSFSKIVPGSPDVAAEGTSGSFCIRILGIDTWSSCWFNEKPSFLHTVCFSLFFVFFFQILPATAAAPELPCPFTCKKVIAERYANHIRAQFPMIMRSMIEGIFRARMLLCALTARGRISSSSTV